MRYCSHDVRPATHLAILNRLWRWGEMHSRQKHASSVSISGVIDTEVNSNNLSSMLFQKLYKETAQTKSTSLPVNYSPGSSHLSYHSNFFSKYAFRSSILTLSCSIVSRSRTVTAPSSSESKSYVTQNGVPISS